MLYQERIEKSLTTYNCEKANEKTERAVDKMG